MELQFIGQPETHCPNALDFLIAGLDDPLLTELWIASAWVHAPGVALLAPSLRRFRARGGRAQLICGLSLGSATVEGLEAARQEFDQVSVAFDPSGRTVHPKLYLLLGAAKACMLVGSQNLTAGGLVTNHEAGLTITGEPWTPAVLDALQFLQRLTADDRIVKVLDRDLLNRLQSSGQVTFATPEAKPLNSSPNEGVDPVFGQSRRLFRSAGAPNLPRKSTRPPAGTAADSPPPNATVPVTKRWFKRLPRADAQRLVGSNPSNTVTLTQSGHAIDKVTWFREKVFGDRHWSPVPGSADHERTLVEFEVRGLGTPFHELMFVEHNLQHGSGQSNRVTSIRWGERTRDLLRHSIDVTGLMFTLERLEDGTFRVTFGETETGSFMD